MNNNSLTDTIQRLQYLLNVIPSKLSLMGENGFNQQPKPGGWSKKQILGHLIDSAANNHQRFIRTQYEMSPSISYDQNIWNDLNHWKHLEYSHVINFWVFYNNHLIEVIKRIPEENLNLQCNTGEDRPVTLKFIIEDYLQHMEHHLKQIVDY